jgi:hypothetical protein
LKRFLGKLVNFEHLSNVIANIWLLMFTFMAWLCFGYIAFGVLFQWIFLLLLPEKYDYTLNVFLIAWTGVGLFLINRVNK